jgi:predicted nucleic acid-binding protein
MSRIILVDTNTLILAIDPTTQSEELVAEAKSKLKQWLSDENVFLVTTPLIRFELLRSGKLSDQRMEKLENILSSFECFPITQADGDLAAQLYRITESNNQSLGKRNFDSFHFACAKNNDFEFHTNDEKDLIKIQNSYNLLKK